MSSVIPKVNSSSSCPGPSLRAQPVLQSAFKFASQPAVPSASPATCTRCVPQQQHISQHVRSIYSQITRQKINPVFKIIYSSLFKLRLTFINSACVSVFFKEPCHSQSQLQPSCSALLLGGLNPASQIVHSQLPYRFLMLKLRQTGVNNRC